MEETCPLKSSALPPFNMESGWNWWGIVIAAPVFMGANDVPCGAGVHRLGGELDIELVGWVSLLFLPSVAG